MYGQNLNMLATSQARIAKHLIEENKKMVKSAIGANIYNDSIMESKLENDALFLSTLIQESTEEDKELYFKHLGILLETTSNFFKEVDLKPRQYSNALNTSKEITESSVLSIYVKAFSDTINKEFAQPLTEGHLISDNEDSAKLILESTLNAGLASDVDAETFIKYALFENTLSQNIKRVMVPEELNESINRFINNQEESYFELFEENAVELIKIIEENAMVLSGIIAPKLFVESSDTDISIDQIKKYQHASALLLKK